MKKLISIILTAAMLLCFGASALAVEPNTAYGDATGMTGGDASTDVIYEASTQEAWQLTVPATIVPGVEPTEDNITLSGTWPSDIKYSVVAPSTVELVNSITGADEKVLDVTFSGLSLAGSNTAEVTATAKISIEAIENALFGTWSGTIEYKVVRKVTNLAGTKWTMSEQVGGYEGVFEFVGDTTEVFPENSILKYTYVDDGIKTSEYEITGFAITAFEIPTVATYNLLGSVHWVDSSNNTCAYIPENEIGIEPGWYLGSEEAFRTAFEAGTIDPSGLFYDIYTPCSVSIEFADGEFTNTEIIDWLYANATLVIN